jgi:hypothetical protein
MPYINTLTNEYPLYVVDLQQADPDWTEGASLPEGFAEVEIAEPPVITERQYLEELPPAFSGEAWKVDFLVKDLTDEEFEQNQNALAREQELLEQGYSYQQAIAIILAEKE